MLQGQSHEYATFLARLLNYVKSFQYQARRENPYQIRHSSQTVFEMILFVDNCILNSVSFCQSLKYILFFLNYNCTSSYRYTGKLLIFYLAFLEATQRKSNSSSVCTCWTVDLLVFQLHTSLQYKHWCNWYFGIQWIGDIFGWFDSLTFPIYIIITVSFCTFITSCVIGAARGVLFYYICP